MPYLFFLYIAFSFLLRNKKDKLVSLRCDVEAGSVMPVTLATQSRDTGDGDAPRSLHKSTCLYTSALLCKTRRKQNQLTWLPFKATSGSFSAIRLLFFPSDRKKKQVSKPVPSIKQQLPLASEACGRQHEAFEQYLWLNGGCRAAPQAPSSSLLQFPRAAAVSWPALVRKHADRLGL